MKYAKANKDTVRKLVFDTITEYELRNSRRVFFDYVADTVFKELGMDVDNRPDVELMLREVKEMMQEYDETRRNQNPKLFDDEPYFAPKRKKNTQRSQQPKRQPWLVERKYPEQAKLKLPEQEPDTTTLHDLLDDD